MSDMFTTSNTGGGESYLFSIVQESLFMDTLYSLFNDLKQTFYWQADRYKSGPTGLDICVYTQNTSG